MRCWGAIIVTGLLAAGATAQDGDLDAARANVRAAYGQREAQVARTDDDDDDIDLAQELLHAGADPSKSAVERFVLTDEAATIALKPGTPRSMDRAREAIQTADRIRPYPPSQKQRRLAEVEAAGLERRRRQHVDPTALVPVAKRAAEAHLDHAEAAAQAGEVSDANEALLEARRLIRTYGLEVLEDRAGQAAEAIEATEKGRQRLTLARQALETAQTAGDAQAVNSAKIALADLVMELDGDLAAAAEHLSGTDDPRQGAAATAAAFLDGQGVPAADLLEALGPMTEWVGALPESSRRTATVCLLDMCDVIAIDPQVGRSALAAAFHTRLKQWTDPSTAGGVRDDPAEAFGALTGERTLRSESRVRIAYDFHDSEQLSDWRNEQGAWNWSREAMICHQGLGRYDEAGVVFCREFRADRPLTLSFRTIATRQVGVRLDFRPWGGAVRDGYRVTMGAGGDQRAIVQGTQFSMFGRRTEDRSLRLPPGQAVQWTLTLDGTGGVSWALDGRTMVAYRPETIDADRVNGAIGIRLQTAFPTERTPTGFDDVVIEGEMVPSYGWRPESEH